jgi:cell wall-associated NlpC family hydrolase
MKYHHLLGKPFQHGVQDCFTLVRDFYFDNYGIELTNYARPDNWWHQGLSLYRDAITPEGFEVLPKNVRLLRPGDGILMAILATEPNHAAIYIGNGKMIHHPFGKLSTIDGLDVRWQTRVTNYLRHTKVPHDQGVERFDLLNDPRVRGVLNYHASRKAG